MRFFTTALCLLVGVLGTYGHSTGDANAIYAGSAPDMAMEQFPYLANDCPPHRELESNDVAYIRKVIITNAERVIKLLTQSPPIYWLSGCGSQCCRVCCNSCPMGCCSLTYFSYHVGNDLQKLVELYTNSTKEFDVPLVTTVGKEKTPESVVLWARADFAQQRNVVSRQILRALSRHGGVKTDDEGEFVELDVAVGCGESGEKRLTQRFEVKDDLDVEVTVGGDFLNEAEVMGMSRECLDSAAAGLKVVAPKRAPGAGKDEL